MESCKYHPDKPYNFQCSRCDEHFCSECVDHSVGGEARCFHCGELLDAIVTEDSVEPFTKRIEKAFRYPFSATAMTFVVGLSVTTTILAAMPLNGFIRLLALLFCFGLSVNYSFLCLKATAQGEMEPPNIADALSESFSILIRLTIMSILISWGVYLISSTLGLIPGILASITVFIGFPAILMSFAMTNSIFAAINPLVFIRLMATLGVSYPILVIFLFIMISSVSLLNSIIGDNLLVLSTIMQSSVSYYYSMVAFHLMGYLLFQYQNKLGIATVDDNEKLLRRAEASEVAMTHVNIQLKEGNYSRASELLLKAVTIEPKNSHLWQRCFDVLYRLGNKEALLKVADKYFSHLFDFAQNDRLLSDFKKLRQLLPTFQPKYAHLRYRLASLYHGQGDTKATVQLINGLHKQHPDFDQLIPAYSLMAQALSEMPNMQGQADKCHQLIEVLKKKAVQPKEEEPPTTKATFNPIEPAPTVENKRQEIDPNVLPEEPVHKEDDRDRPIDFF